MKRIVFSLCMSFVLVAASIASAMRDEPAKDPGAIEKPTKSEPSKTEKPNLDPPDEPDIPGVRPGHERPDRPDKPEKPKPDKPLGEKPGSIHSEGKGWGSMSTGKGVEPSGYSKDKVIGVGVTIHFLRLPPASKTYLELPSLR